MKLSLVILILGIVVKTSGQPNELDLLIKEKREIEEQLKSKKNDVIVLVRVKGENRLQLVKDEKWPADIETTFNIFRNESGNVIYLAEIPTSQSGDWTLELKNYFNDQGETFAFEKRLTFFNEDCGDGVVIEKLTDFFRKGFKLIATLKQLRDGKDNSITDREKCSDHYQWIIDKKGTVQELMKSKQIEL